MSEPTTDTAQLNPAPAAGLATAAAAPHNPWRLSVAPMLDSCD